MLNVQMTKLFGPTLKSEKSCFPWLFFAFLVIALDLFTKYLASTQLSYARPVEILPFLNFTLLHNPGAAFSFLASAGGWQRWFFTVIGLVTCVVLYIWLVRTPRKSWWIGLGLTAIMGGAIGNVYDRLMHGYVVDFISLNYQGWYFPAFNIADSAISLGVILLILDSVFLHKLSVNTSEKE